MSIAESNGLCLGIWYEKGIKLNEKKEIWFYFAYFGMALNWMVQASERASEPILNYSKPERLLLRSF